MSIFPVSPWSSGPANSLAIGDIAQSWKTNRQEELDCWNEELAESKSKTSIEEKVQRGCSDQLQQAEDWRALLDFRGLKASDLGQKIEEYKRERHDYFLLEAMDAEGKRENQLEISVE